MTPQELTALEALAQTWMARSAKRLEDSETEPTITTQRKLLHGAQCTMKCGTELLAQMQAGGGKDELKALRERWIERALQRRDDAEAEPTQATRSRLEYGAHCTFECEGELQAQLGSAPAPSPSEPESEADAKASALRTCKAFLDDFDYSADDLWFILTILTMAGAVKPGEFFLRLRTEDGRREDSDRSAQSCAG